MKVWIIKSTLGSHMLVSSLALHSTGFSLLCYPGVPQCYTKMTYFKNIHITETISLQRELNNYFHFFPLDFKLVRFLSSWRALVILSSIQSHGCFNCHKITSLPIFFKRYLIIAIQVYWWIYFLIFIKHNIWSTVSISSTYILLFISCNNPMGVGNIF